MSRILTGIQSTGRPHLGNLLGAILPAIELSRNPANDSLYFIADLHSLTTVRDPAVLRANTYAVAAAWLACGFDTEKNLFYRQSDVPQVTELTWYLSCFTPYPMLANAHSFKDKSDKLSDVNAGLFTYPVLMAADILLYDADIVPVGKDQVQHLEIARDIAQAFNTRYGDTLVLPQARVDAELMTIPGTDGAKMSKSYGNAIALREDEDSVTKKVRTMPTDPARVRRTDPGNPEICLVGDYHKLFSDDQTVLEIWDGCRTAGIGCIDCKKRLMVGIERELTPIQARAEALRATPDAVLGGLHHGAERARAIAAPVMDEVRSKMGFLGAAAGR